MPTVVSTQLSRQDLAKATLANAKKPEEIDITNIPLDYILFEVKEPQRTWAMEKYMDPENDAQVLIKCNDKSMFQKKIDGKVWSFPPRGARISRRLAPRLLRMYGEKGQYRFKDQRTMHDEASFEALEPEERAFLEKKGINFEQRFLYDASYGDREVVPDEEVMIFNTEIDDEFDDNEE